MKKRNNIADTTGTVFNIVRKQRGQVTIIMRELPRSKAVIEVTNLKRRARDMHSNVYFDMVEVPYELTEKGKAEAREREEKRAIEAFYAMQDAKIAACVAAGKTDLDEDGFCHNCDTFHPAPEQAAA